MSAAPVLGSGRSARRCARPRRCCPTLFIPLFFLVVNVGQAAKIFPSGSTPFLHGPELRRLPAAELAAARRVVRHARRCSSSRTSRAATSTSCARRPISRTAIVLGRLIAEAVKSVLIATRDRAARRCRSASRSRAAPLGFVLLVLLTALWAVVFAGFMQLIALKTRSAAATNSGGLIFFPLLFLTPNFVPRDLLTRPMEIAATLNPVTYVMEAMRSLILEDLDWARSCQGLRRRRRARRGDVLLNVRTISHYD